MHRRVDSFSNDSPVTFMYLEFEKSPKERRCIVANVIPVTFMYLEIDDKVNIPLEGSSA